MVGGRSIRALIVSLIAAAMAAGCGVNSGLLVEVPGPLCEVIEADGLRLVSTRQFNFARPSGAARMAIDDLGGIYIVGNVQDPAILPDEVDVYFSGFPTEPPDEADVFCDGFIAKIDSQGVAWCREIAFDGIWGITDVACGPAGTVYAVGDAAEHERWGKHWSGRDAVVKLGPQGQLLWRCVYGTSLSSFQPSQSICVASDGFCYVAGSVSKSGEANGDRANVYIAAIGPDGTFQWQIEFGSQAEDRPYDIALEAHNEEMLYVVGATKGDLAGANQGGEDVFVAAYFTKGFRRWLHQFGDSGQNRGLAVADADHVESVLVRSLWETDQGTQHALTRFDAREKIEWHVPLEHGGSDRVRAIAYDEDGNCYVASDREFRVLSPAYETYDCFTVEVFGPDGKAKSVIMWKAEWLWDVYDLAVGPDGDCYVLWHARPDEDEDPSRMFITRLSTSD